MRVALAAVIGVVGVFFVVVSLFFADWSGEHRISWPGVIVGVILLLPATVMVISSIRRAANRRNSAP